MRTAAIAIALLTLAGCGESDNAPGPGGVTVGEARALDDAAEMIEARRMPQEALRPPAPNSTPATSNSAAPAR